ncbi:hypothetical protein [Xanthovirga aplysinae]|uniref:hypothetical protein n=1 Tax=Xanthovirga aplysinae TaxID=2529853 RepID=UPI0012BB9E2E|nr:hypothetical protein [Xanthovirga aplysinae]MTI33379.1 hypothetical protein [Xanthovirga aplysinae]
MMKEEAIEKYLPHTKYIKDLHLDIGYLITEQFFFGATAHIPNTEWLKKRATLYKPQIKLFEGFVLSEYLEGYEREMELYFLNVQELAQKYDKQLENGDPYFWVAPLVFKKDVGVMGFPWFDTFQQAKYTLQLFQANNEGTIFYGRQPQWELTVHADQHKFYFIYRNPEENTNLWLINTDKAPIQQKVTESLKRTEKQIAHFSKTTGVDYWN